MLTNMDRDCSWVLSSLWKEDCMFSYPVPILDTLVLNRGISEDLIWMYSDSKGIVTRRNHGEEHFSETLRVYFNEKCLDARPLLIETKLKSPVVYIKRDSYTILKESHSLRGLLSEGLSDKTVFIKLANNESSFLYTEYRKGTLSCFKEFQGKTLTLKSPQQTKTLTKLTQNIIRTVEKNQKTLVKHMSLCFITDKTKAIWFLGTNQCTDCPQHKRSLHLSLHSKTNSSSTVFSSFSSPANTRCQGDFCRLTLTSKAKLPNCSTDYDALVTSNQLLQVKKAYFSKDEHSIEKAQQELRVDDLQRHLHLKQTHKLPYRAILLGRSFLLTSGLYSGKATELHINDFISSFASLSHSSLQSSPANTLYSIAQVCANCYEVYTLMISLRGKKLAAPSSRQTHSKRCATEEAQFKSLLARVYPDSLRALPAKTWRGYISNLRSRKYG